MNAKWSASNWASNEQREQVHEDEEQLSFAAVHDAIIGWGEQFAGAFGKRRLLYCDFTSSGRAVSMIEDYIREQILPRYGNTHTLSSVVGRQTTMFREEARMMLKRWFNGQSSKGSPKDVTFAFSRATFAAHAHALTRSSLRAVRTI
jgi:selenocysteine lyase/cysteine desulfurase